MSAFAKINKKTLSATIRWAGTLLSLALFIWLLSLQKWEVVLAKMAAIPLWMVFLVTALYLSAFGFNTLRWCILLWAQGVRIPYWQAFRMTWAGNFASNFLPSTVGGDGLRMVGIFRYTDQKTVGIGSVMLDRIINMTAMACLLPVSFFMFGGLLMSLVTGHVLPQTALAMPAGLKHLFERWFPKVLNAFHIWASHPRTLGYAFLAAWPSNLLPMVAVYLIARQFGMEVSFLQVISVQTLTYFVSVLPISTNGMGLREIVFTALYMALGAAPEQSAGLALVTRFLMLVSTIPGALWLSGSVTDVALNDTDPGS